MNPLEFSWTEDQQITVTNPTAETYKFKVHSKEYQIEPGRSAKMPGYIAWVYVYGLSTQLAQADGVFNRWNEEGFRQEYYEKLVSGVDPVMQAVEIEPQPLVETLDEPAEQSEPEEPADEEEGEPEPAEPVSSKVEPMKPKATTVRSASR